jgi:tetratricopeptide (TPR) repeat protein/DNA-binding XRE family transcriptional regulator
VPRRPSTHVDDPVAVGQRLRRAREAAGLTQRDLSFEGCTAAYVSRIEAGARVPSLQILREFGKRLGVSADFLATGGPGGADLSSELLEAEVALRLGDGEQAARLYDAARRAASSPAAIARTQLGLGRVALHRGDVAGAIDLVERALESGALGDADSGVAGNALGRAYASQGRYHEAVAIFERYLEDARTRGDRFDQVRFGMLLATAYVDDGDDGRARATLGEILDLARQTVDPMLRASAYWSQSRVHLSQGDSDRAAEYANLALATLKASEQTLEAVRALLLLAFIENDRGNPDAALELVDEGEPIVTSAGETKDAAMFTIERARALSELGKVDEAVAFLLDIEARLTSAPPDDAARAYAAAADIFREQGDSARALELYELAVEQAPVANRHVAAALTAMAEIYEERGEAEMALVLLKRALAARTGSPA